MRTLCFRNTSLPWPARNGLTSGRGRPKRPLVFQKHKVRLRAAMSCAFDLAHYRELLDAAQAGGYRFAFFEGAPEAGD